MNVILLNFETKILISISFILVIRRKIVRGVISRVAVKRLRPAWGNAKM